MTGDPEAAAEIAPECDAELVAGLGKSEQRIAAIAAKVVHQPFGMHPAQRVAAHGELPGIVTRHYGIA